MRITTALATLVILLDLAIGIAAGRAAQAAEAVAGSAAVLMGWFLLVRVPGSLVAPALAWSSASVVLTDIVDSITQGALGERAAAFTEPFNVAIWPTNLAGLVALLVVFPDGRADARPARPAIWLYVASSLAILVGLWGGGEPRGLAAVLAWAGLVGIAVALSLAVATLVVRYRAGGELRRMQIRWLMLAGGSVVVLMVLGWGVAAMGGGVWLSYAPFLGAIVFLVPLAVTISIFRYDLFDIDRILSEGTALVLTALVAAAAYGSVVASIDILLNRFTAIGAAAGGFVAALLLLPTHRLLLQGTGFLLDRDRFLGVRAVERFAGQMRLGIRQPEEIESVLQAAQGDEDLTLLLRDEDRWVTLAGDVRPDVAGVVASRGGEALVKVHLGRTSRRAERRVQALLQAAWIPIEVARLQLGLRQSQARRAEAAAKERKRLERDLHDGAQQSIIATGMRLRAVQRRLSAEDASEIDLAVAELEATVEELRRLAHGVRPSRLDDGLEAALAGICASTPIPVDLQVSKLPEVEDSRELAAFLVVAESITNVLKHARAQSISVRISGAGARLVIEIADDGVGGVSERGSLVGLRDRVQSVGGTLSVDSAVGEGTCVKVVL